MKAKHIIKSIVFMLAIALMTPGVFAQTKVQKEKKEQNIKQVDRSKIQKLEVEKEIPNRQQDVRDLGKPTFDRFGNPTGFQKPGSNSSSPPPKSELQEKWAETNCGKQPYGDFYDLSKDPCPSGYRLPTLEEFENLLNKYEWNSDNTPNDNPGKVKGSWCGESKNAVQNATASDPKGCIFFPYSGWFSTRYNEYIDKDKQGAYPSSYKGSGDAFYTFKFGDGRGSMIISDVKLTVRCVKK